MFREVLRRLPDLELADDEPSPYRPSNFISGPEAHAGAVHADGVVA